MRTVVTAPCGCAGAAANPEKAALSPSISRATSTTAATAYGLEASPSTVLSLQGLPGGTKLSYVRYLDGKFIDSKSAVIGAGANHFYSTFAAVTGQSLAAGTYRLRLYVNEHASREVVYRVT
jgi:hypothetical protein